MAAKSFLGQIRDAVIADSYGRKPNGDVIVRNGYFYSHGRTADAFAEVVALELKKAGIAFHIKDHGNHWAAFNGRHTVAQGSHFWVVIAPGNLKDKS